ncbi:glycosyltransferase family 4 protein [Inquilinus sp. KBS0705]|nr:glycosyltransferase family 4 protein [Inquilinus sp. KBS0705]
MLRVLMIARNTLNLSPGGDTIQIISTAKYLQKLNVKVDIHLTGDIIDYSQYNLIHFFNIIRPDDIIPHIIRSKLPFVTSTIFVDYSEYEIRNRSGLTNLFLRLLNKDQIEYLKVIGRFLKNGDRINSLSYLLKGHRASVRYVAKRSAILLPNSHNEYKRFTNHYCVDAKYKKVFNAIDTEVFNETIEVNEQFKDYIICVGRIEGRKNQLNLIKAVLNTDLKLAIIGKPSPNHMSYYNECKSLAEGSNNVVIIEHISQIELRAIYKAAKVHVLASWFETTGLSSLEAAIMDCNIVITNKGDTKEYFKQYAFYCEPDNVTSIKSAIIKAYTTSVNPGLKELVCQYTWLRAAEQTLEAYKEILKD